MLFYFIKLLERMAALVALITYVVRHYSRLGDR